MIMGEFVGQKRIERRDVPVAGVDEYRGERQCDVESACHLSTECEQQESYEDPESDF